MDSPAQTLASTGELPVGRMSRDPDEYQTQQRWATSTEHDRRCAEGIDHPPARYRAQRDEDLERGDQERSATPREPPGLL
jgi:hypothetical protein